MLGMFFVNISPDPNSAGRLLVKTGIVKSQVGSDRWLLEFTAKGYNFSNVFRAEQLEQFAFFNTPAARQAFLDELVASNALATAASAPAADAAVKGAPGPLAQPSGMGPSEPLTEAPPASEPAP